MIITDNDIFYMTGGETCYSVAVKDGRLCRAYFGKRVEPEDDLAALGGVARSLPTSADGICAVDVYRHGKKLRPDFIFDGYELTDKPVYDDMPVLRGGKTLKLTLKDEGTRLALDLFFTPYARGGLARRAVLVNIGDDEVSVGRLDCATDLDDRFDTEVSGAKSASAVGTGKYNFVFASDGATEFSGDVYGMLLMYGGEAAVKTESADCSTRIILGADIGGRITLAPGESFVAPETLSVFSDVGYGGASRAFHDILRENAMPENYFARRRPVTLRCSTDFRDAKKLGKAVEAASELGADVFVADGDGLYNGCAEDDKFFKRLAEECSAHGIKLGIAVDPQRIEASGAIYKENKELMIAHPSGEDGYILDFSRAEAVELAYSRICKCVSDCGAEYVLLKGGEACGSGVTRYLGVLGMQKLLSRLIGASDIVVERASDIRSDAKEGGYADGRTVAMHTAAHPLCVLRNIVSIPSDNGDMPLKSRFDAATFGSLGYSLDPTALGEDARCAIRAQVFSYQDDAQTVVSGDLYRLGGESGDLCIMAVAKDKSKAYAVYIGDGAHKVRRIKFRGLDEHALYRVRELNKTFSGAALTCCGIAIENAEGGCVNSLTFHFGQVADYE